MTKPYSEVDFSQQIMEDRTWRMREISDLRSLANRSDEQMQRVLLRAMITICYAHWEGYVRFSARKFMEHIALRKFLFSELDRQFWQNHFLPKLASLSRTNTSLLDRCELVGSILAIADERFSRPVDDLVITRSNLSFGVFADICLVCAIDVSQFSDYETYVDTFLLRRRNAIAHGEETFVEVEDLSEISDKTITLMRMFGDALDNKVQLKQYKSA